MTEVQNEVRVRNVSTRRSESFVESAIEFGGGIVRLGFSVATLPLALLPNESRGHLRNAARELMYAVVELPRDLANVAGDAVEAWAAEVETPTVAPKDELTKA